MYDEENKKRNRINMENHISMDRHRRHRIQGA